MTLKTSFFNKAIYKSILKRYLWGPVVYFVLLFLSSGFYVLIDSPDKELAEYYGGFISRMGMLVPIIMAIAVPTVTALMVFRFVHSKSQAIFTFSLPATRGASVISAFLGGLTLMFVPVILNGIILLLISAGGYGWYVSFSDCFVWMGYNILALFMMYSCAVFSVSITGNAFSGIIVNILFHSFPAIIVSAFETMGYTFLYGFTHDNTVATIISENNFVVSVFKFGFDFWRDDFAVNDFVVYISASVVLCVLAYVLFVKRKAETASDVGGFRCLNSIFKYAITLFVTLLVFNIVSHRIVENTFGFVVLMIIFSLLSYTLSEMVIRKKLNVFYAWKGWVGFGACFILIMLTFAYTSFFGYETRIPSPQDIQSVSVHGDYYMDEAYASDDDLSDSVTKIHSDLIAGNIPVICDDEDTMFKDNIYITYKLKDGTRMSRRYIVSVNKFKDIVCELYENEAYKMAHEPIFMDKEKFIYYEINNSRYEGNVDELTNALKKDILMLDYETIHPEYFSKSYITLYYINMEYAEKNGIVRKREIRITDDFVNTVAYLKETE